MDIFKIHVLNRFPYIMNCIRMQGNLTVIQQPLICLTVLA
jgi:hypothetical protein